MYRSLQILAVVLVGVAMALSLAHPLSCPAKCASTKRHIWPFRNLLPGLHHWRHRGAGGDHRPSGPPCAHALREHALLVDGGRLSRTRGHPRNLLVRDAPVNNFWTRDIQLTGIGATFFSLFAADITGDWAKLRDVWEYSHLARSVFAMLGLVFLLIAVTA
jgi:hypothetical protein